MNEEIRNEGIEMKQEPLKEIELENVTGGVEELNGRGWCCPDCHKWQDRRPKTCPNCGYEN